MSYPSTPRAAPVSPVAPGAEPGAPTAQARLDLDPSGVQRIVWESRYGPILIELVGDRVLVNGQAVVPASLPARPVR